MQVEANRSREERESGERQRQPKSPTADFSPRLVGHPARFACSDFAARPQPNG